MIRVAPGTSPQFLNLCHRRIFVPVGISLTIRKLGTPIIIYLGCMEDVLEPLTPCGQVYQQHPGSGLALLWKLMNFDDSIPSFLLLIPLCIVLMAWMNNWVLIVSSRSLKLLHVVEYSQHNLYPLLLRFEFLCLGWAKWWHNIYSPATMLQKDCSSSLLLLTRYCKHAGGIHWQHTLWYCRFREKILCTTSTETSTKLSKFRMFWRRMALIALSISATNHRLRLCSPHQDSIEEQFPLALSRSLWNSHYQPITVVSEKYFTQHTIFIIHWKSIDQHPSAVYHWIIAHWDFMDGFHIILVIINTLKNIYSWRTWKIRQPKLCSDMQNLISESAFLSGNENSTFDDLKTLLWD